jgi:hypothetical protein
MAQQDQPTNIDYPHGRGYGHDYMRGGEVFGGYGYSEREEYERPRGELSHDAVHPHAVSPDGLGEVAPGEQRT